MTLTDSNDPKPSRKTGIIVGAVIAAVTVFVGLAIMLGGKNESAVSPATVVTDTAAGGDASATAAPTLGQTAPVEVSGSLPLLSDPNNDPAVGMAAPTVKGTSFNGTPVTLEPGKPTLLMLVAHWCSHCQKEVSVVKDWIAAQDGLGDMRLVVVSTGVEATYPNYPPSAWLLGSGLPAEFIRDDDKQSVAAAFGLDGFPMTIGIRADGKIAVRTSGERTEEDLNQIRTALLSTAALEPAITTAAG